MSLNKYIIYKDGLSIEQSSVKVSLNDMKKRLRELHGHTLHVISGDVISVYRLVNNRVLFCHMKTK